MKKMKKSSLTTKKIGIHDFFIDIYLVRKVLHDLFVYDVLS